MIGAVRMHSKFCPGGKNNVTVVVNYVIREKDANGIIRPGVTVLRGDPQSVIDVGSSLTFKTKYSAAIIAFHPDDKPTKEQIDEVLDSFEEAMFAGLDKTHSSYIAVKHDEAGGGCHIHIIINKIDLKTGKHFNPAPPGWQKFYDPLRDYFNYKYGWARPDDPKRQRYLQPGRMASVMKHVALEERFTQAHLKKELHDLLMERIIDGQIQNRNEMFHQLKDLNFNITRKGKNYITVVDRKTKIRTRLKGKLYYEQEYTDEFKRALTETKENETDRQSNTRKNDPEKAEYCYRQYLERYKSKAADNFKRYRQEAQGNAEHSKSKKRRISVDEFKIDIGSLNIVPNRNRSNSLPIRHGQATIGKSEKNSKSVNITSISSAGYANKRGHVSDITDRETDDLSIWKSIGNKIIKLIGVKNDSTGIRIIERTRKVIGSIFKAARRNQETNGTIESAYSQVDDCLSKVKKDIRREVVFCKDKKSSNTNNKATSFKVL